MHDGRASSELVPVDLPDACLPGGFPHSLSGLVVALALVDIAETAAGIQEVCGDGMLLTAVCDADPLRRHAFQLRCWEAVSVPRAIIRVW